jgi:CheY-like chemotaxis protein
MSDQAASPREPRRRTVLVVDDEEANRQLMSALLSALGLKVLTARDGPTGLSMLAEGGIDLVLLDVMMPGMDGMEVCRRVRQELRLTELFVVFVTALSDRDSRMRAKQAGANDFLVKPVDSFELHFRAHQWLKLGQLHDLEESVQRLERGLVALAEASSGLAAPLAELADRALATPAQASELAHTATRVAEQLAQISADATRVAAESRESRSAPQRASATTAATIPVVSRNQSS